MIRVTDEQISEPDELDDDARDDDFPHESLEIPSWVQLVTGLILVALMALAILKAIG